MAILQRGIPAPSGLSSYTADEIVGKHFSRFFIQEDVERGRPAELTTAGGRFVAALKKKAGAFARTARVSGPTSS